MRKMGSAKRLKAEGDRDARWSGAGATRRACRSRMRRACRGFAQTAQNLRRMRVARHTSRAGMAG